MLKGKDFIIDMREKTTQEKSRAERERSRLYMARTICKRGDDGIENRERIVRIAGL